MKYVVIPSLFACLKLVQLGALLRGYSQNPNSLRHSVAFSQGVCLGFIDRYNYWPTQWKQRQWVQCGIGTKMSFHPHALLPGQYCVQQSPSTVRVSHLLLRRHPDQSPALYCCPCLDLCCCTEKYKAL